MTPEDIERVQGEFAAESQALDCTYWEGRKYVKTELVNLLNLKRAVWEKYAAQYPEWAAWSRELPKHAIG